MHLDTDGAVEGSCLLHKRARTILSEVEKRGGRVGVCLGRMAHSGSPTRGGSGVVGGDAHGAQRASPGGAIMFGHVLDVRLGAGDPFGYQFGVALSNMLPALGSAS